MDAIRFEIDHRDSEDQFILTGSAVSANMDDVTHTTTRKYTYKREDDIYVVPIGCLKN